MIRYVISRLFRNPVTFIRNAFYKTLIGPLKYSRGGDYDARRYWRDRFARHGTSLRGPGDEGLSEQDNKKDYEAAGRLFTELCLKEGVDFPNAAVLEIGVGTGFYTGLLRRAGVKKYLGMDITDVLFGRLREEYPQFEFVRGDITSDIIEGKFDLIVMMDVVEHIVSESKLTSAMKNVRRCMSERGVFVLSGIQEKARKHLFYNRSWSPRDIIDRFPGCRVKGPIPFRGNNVLIVRVAAGEHA